VRPHRLPLTALAVTSLGLLGAYFLNSPQPVLEFDSQNSLGTPTYVGAAKDLVLGHLLSTGRLPGYPLLLALLGGANGFFAAVVAVQAVFFVLAVLLTYCVAWWAFRARWIAFLVALMVATDVYAAAYAKEILSEALALVLLAGLMAALASFVLRPRPAVLWAIAAVATAITFTRAEWTFLPLALALYFLAWGLRRPLPRAVIVHGLGALVASYALVGLYVAGNAVVNGYPGTSEINNVSILGKVMQYNMQLEAPPKYQAQALLVDRYVNVTHLNVWHVVTENPDFATDHYQLSGAFGRAVVMADPVRYAKLSLEIAFTHNADVDRPLLHIAAGGPLRLELSGLAKYTQARYSFYWLLPAFGLLWLVLPLLRRRESSLDALGPVAAVVTYGALIVAFGGFDEYGRYHTVYLPASNLLVWGTLLLNVVIASRASVRLQVSVPALVLVELVAVVVLATAPSFLLSVAISLVIAILQGIVIWLGTADESLEASPPRAQPAPRTQD
jgi:hypothetical protein